MPHILWQKRSTDSWPVHKKSNSLFFTSIFLFFLAALSVGCASSQPEAASVGVPKGPDSEASIDSFTQGLRFIRENPSQREDERVQHFLWLDQWISILGNSNRLTPELGQELYRDLTSYVSEPELGQRSLDQIERRAQSRLGKNVISYYLYLNALRESTIEAAVSHLRKIEEEPYSDLPARAQELLALQGDSTVTASTGKIGVLVPLSGELKSYGFEVLNALQVLSGFAATEGVEFVVADSGSTNESLLNALQRLAVNEGVIAIIGPVTTSASQFVFERAEILRVPVISLAPRERLELIGQYSFRSAITLRDQITALSTFIRDRLRARRVAVMFPDKSTGGSDYGWEAGNIAKEVFERAGLEIKHMAVYAPGTTDFKDPLRLMTRLDQPRVRQDEVCPARGPAFPGCVPKIGDLPPILDFEVLMVADFADTAGLVLPTLPFLRIYGVQVVGLSGLNSPRLVERGQQSAEGVIFTDSYVTDSNDFKNRIFIERYRELAGADPSKVSAEAFDVGSILIDLLKKGAKDREALRTALSRMSSFDGLTGRLFVEAQQIRKEPRFLVVRDGKFREFK